VSKYISLASEEELLEAFQNYSLNTSNTLVLGGGSNVILPPALDQYILSFKTQTPKEGSVIRAEDNESVLIDVEAGVEWDAFVEYCVEKDYFGLENLSLIPGTVGAAPIQNIGAYGVEVADYIQQVKVFNISTKEFEIYTRVQCKFSYRNSLFKQKPGQFIIVSVSFHLKKAPCFILDYGELSTLRNNQNLNSIMVRNAVIKTRQEKLPDPKILPNAGSFFKNPVVNTEQFSSLKQQFPTIVAYPLVSGDFKLAAAWLIDQAGWKGYRNNHVGIHDKQALVIVNHNQGSQAEILSLASLVQDSVSKKFNVVLEIEPVVIWS
jgi:UDP-N-acetylmuramate dehydrogenase